MEIRDVKQSPYRRFFTKNKTIEELVLQAKQKENVAIRENAEKAIVSSKPPFADNTNKK